MASTVFDAVAAGAWCTIALATGLQLRTNSADDLPAGARFVALDRDGTPLRSWLSPEWPAQAQAETAMAAIWRACSAGRLEILHSRCGPEYVTVLAGGGRVCCDIEGSAVRLVDVDGSELDGGSAYWVLDEWVDEPEEVMGAICGAAAALAGA